MGLRRARPRTGLESLQRRCLWLQTGQGQRVWLTQAFLYGIYYYTDPFWLNDNRSFVFTSDRENQSNLFRYDLDTRSISSRPRTRG